MGSSPSKEVHVRSRSGLSFVSTSSTDSLDTIATDADEGTDTVQNFVFDEISIKSFHVRWGPPTNFNPVSYQVRLFPPDKIKSRTLLKALPEPTHTFTRLKSCTQYSVAVIATDANGNKTPCATANVWTLPRPPRDIQFPSNTRSDSLQVTWKHCKGKPGSYDVHVTAEGEQTSIATAIGLKQTGRVFKDMMPGIVYSVSVTNVVNGQSSQPLTGTFMTAPRYVSDATFSDVTHHEMTFKWKRPEGKIDSYTLELSESTWQPGKPIEIEGLKKTFYTFNGLTPGRLYNCKITSMAQHKSSQPQVFTQCTVPQEVAGIATRDVGPDEALVTWTPASGDADSYDLFLTPKDGVIGETTPRGVTKTQYQFTGLVPGTVYTIGIVTNSKDKSSKRVVSGFATLPGMCGEIEVSSTERTCTTQRINWPPAGGRVDSYTISIRREDKQQDGWMIDDIFQPHHVITDLTPGTLYYVEVAAMRDGRESSTVSKVFGTVPSPVPSMYFPKDQCSWNQITLSWETSIGGVQSYSINAKCEGGVAKEVLVSSDSAEYVFTSLHPATVYTFSISSLSNEIFSVSKTAKQITGPASVGNFSVTSSNKREIVISWTSPDQGADDYLLKLRSLEDENTQHPLELTTSKTEHVFSGLIPGMLYKVEITPVSSSIEGKSSSTEVYTKPGDILNVHIPEDLVTLNSITVKWWGVEGNCKDVDVILSRLKKCQDDDSETSPLVVKEEHVHAEDAKASEVTFTDLESATVYGIRLKAVGKAGVGADTVFTQATLTPVKVVTEESNSEKKAEESVCVEPQPETEKQTLVDLMQDVVDTQKEVTQVEGPLEFENTQLKEEKVSPVEPPSEAEDTQPLISPIENLSSPTEEISPEKDVLLNATDSSVEIQLPTENCVANEDVKPCDVEPVSAEVTKPSTPPVEENESVLPTLHQKENETESQIIQEETPPSIVESVGIDVSNVIEASAKQEGLSSVNEDQSSTNVIPQDESNASPCATDPPESEENKNIHSQEQEFGNAATTPPVEATSEPEDIVPLPAESTDNKNETDGSKDNVDDTKEVNETTAVVDTEIHNKSDIKDTSVDTKKVKFDNTQDIHPVFVLPSKSEAGLNKRENPAVGNDHNTKQQAEESHLTAPQTDSNAASPAPAKKERQLAFLASLTSDQDN